MGFQVENTSRHIHGRDSFLRGCLERTLNEATIRTSEVYPILLRPPAAEVAAPYKCGPLAPVPGIYNQSIPAPPRGGSFKLGSKGVVRRTTSTTSTYSYLFSHTFENEIRNCNTIQQGQ